MPIYSFDAEDTMAQEEKVLVIERRIIEEIGMFQGFIFDIDKYMDTIYQSSPRFIPRSQAENNSDFKQLIPYVIIAHNGKYLSYVRGKRAGETRLLGNRSIGIGGHINPIDDMSLFSFYDTYQTAVQREVNEEVALDTTYSAKILGLLNDDSNEVGKVHLGVVHLWELDKPAVEKREQMITQMTFMSSNELNEIRDTLETWSSLCLDHLMQSHTL